MIDPDRTRQILQNLLSNAIRHSPSGEGINITVESSPLPSHVSNPALNSNRASLIWVAVTDTGPGIPTRDLPHVFDRFWRADKSRSRDQGGSGLGLAIAKQLVEAQGGQIGVESVSNSGSSFWFTVPIAP